MQLLHVLAGKLAHHALHRVKLLEQAVYINDRCAAAGGNSLFARGIEYRRIVALGLSHREDYRLDASHALFIDLCALERLCVNAGNHAGKIVYIAHTLERAHLIEVIGKREAVCLHSLGHFKSFFLVKALLGLFYKREHIAHAEDARGHTVGVERLDLIELFADADEFDGLAGACFYRKRRAAARIAVKLREHDAGDTERVVECVCRVHGILAGHCIDNEQYLARFYLITDVLKLLHKLLVNVQAACRIEEHKVVAVLFRMLDCGLCDIDGICRSHLEHGDVELFADGFQLLYGSRAIDIARGQQRTLALLAHIGCKLCAVCRFTGTLKADEHNHARRL